MQTKITGFQHTLGKKLLVCAVGLMLSSEYKASQSKTSEGEHMQLGCS